MSRKDISTASLWRDQSFVLYWLGRAISLLGTAITSVVLPILVYRLTTSAFLTSLLATLEVLPYFCFGLFAGVLADRTDRRRLMVGCDLLNTLLLGSIPLAAVFHVLTIPHIFVVAFLSAAAYVWFDAANFGALPTLVGRARCDSHKRGLVDEYDCADHRPCRRRCPGSDNWPSPSDQLRCAELCPLRRVAFTNPARIKHPTPDRDVIPLVDRQYL